MADMNVRHVQIAIVVLVVATLVHVVRRNPLLLLGIGVRSFCPTIPCRPHLFVCTHDYEHIDLLAIGRETNYWKLHSGIDATLVVANAMHNHVYDALACKNARCMPVKGQTVRKALERLKSEHVCIFLYRDATGPGIYHILRNHRGPCVLIRITSDDADVCEVKQTGVLSCVRGTMLSSYELHYAPLAASTLSMLRLPAARGVGGGDARAHPQRVMRQIKAQLYGASFLNQVQK